MKCIYGIPEVHSLMYRKKHKLIKDFQLAANEHFGDRRRVNAVFKSTNPQQETYLFARYGSRKGEIILTIGVFIGKDFTKEYVKPLECWG